MSEVSKNNLNQEGGFQRRNVLKAIGIALFTSAAIPVVANEKSLLPRKKSIQYFSTITDLKEETSLKEYDIIRTTGYHEFSDGGHAEYLIQKAENKKGGSIALKNGFFAVLINVSTVNYKMFGVVGNGQNDDGVQIKAAHHFANQSNLPVVNVNGEYWIKNTHDIKIFSSVDWGHTIFHIDEKYNSPKASRFVISEPRATKTIDFSAEDKTGFLKKLKPGVNMIPELARYSNCLVIIADKNDQIGFRSGAKYTGQSWAREDFFYVEEHGRILGDIAWEFKDYTSLVAIPVSETHLVVNGGAFYLSGDSQGKSYTRNGFSITRSRTTIKNQWVGLEPGKQDIAMSPRTGFYAFTRVYDVTLENIRLIPYEQDRAGVDKDVPAGTYGISAGRILNGTFRNVTAEGGPIHWGVFGTNLNKNFKIENSKLNRVDVHFHCWNLHIKDTHIGYRGISVTGGGNLLIENSTCASRSFINFRRDFGAKWDGNIRIQNCRFIPAEAADNSVLQFDPMNFNYRYPIGFGRSLVVENLVIDYTYTNSKVVCWLMKTPVFSKTKDGQRLFFPNFIQFKNILTVGRDEGVRLLKINDLQGFDLGKNGSYDGIQLQPNAAMYFENVQLENLEHKDLSGKEEVHIAFGKTNNAAAYDELSLYPEVKFVDCKGIVGNFEGHIAAISFSKCSVVKLVGNKQGSMPGKLSFTECLFAPAAQKLEDISLVLASDLGTTFTNCTVHSPKINGAFNPQFADKIDFIKINKTVRFNHLNTLLGRDILNYYKTKGIALNPKFIAMLKSHHELESDSM